MLWNWSHCWASVLRPTKGGRCCGWGDGWGWWCKIGAVESWVRAGCWADHTREEVGPTWVTWAGFSSIQSPVSLAWVIWICISNFAGSNPSSPIGKAAVQHGVIPLILSCRQPPPCTGNGTVLPVPAQVMIGLPYTNHWMFWLSVWDFASFSSHLINSRPLLATCMVWGWSAEQLIQGRGSLVSSVCAWVPNCLKEPG